MHKLYPDIWVNIINQCGLEQLLAIGRCNKLLHNLAKKRLELYQQDQHRYVTAAIDYMSTRLSAYCTPELYIEPTRQGLSLKSLTKKLLKRRDRLYSGLLRHMFQSIKSNNMVRNNTAVLTLKYFISENGYFFTIFAGYICSPDTRNNFIKQLDNNNIYDITYNHPEDDSGRYRIECILKRAWKNNYTISSSTFLLNHVNKTIIPSLTIRRLML